MNEAAGWSENPLFGHILIWIHFETLPQTNGLISSNSRYCGAIRIQSQIENSLLVTWKESFDNFFVQAEGMKYSINLCLNYVQVQSQSNKVTHHWAL